MAFPNQWGWSSGATYGISNVTSGTNVIYPSAVSFTPQIVALPGVMESPATELGDREWLDAQISEVCELAEAA